jgi:dTDP-4-amino-4,6-dideoxygalactose transaminase
VAFDKILKFERALAEYTGAPYAIMTDCCTHAIELCLRYERPKHVLFTPYTYLSVPMTMHKLGIPFEYLDSNDQWIGEYHFVGSCVWDSARRLERDMYRPGTMQCLSFGHSKPIEIGHGGAILLDNETAYNKLIRMRYDGRDLNISPWSEQVTFEVGYHYRPTIEDANRGLALLEEYKKKDDTDPVYVQYPDCRLINIE